MQMLKELICGLGESKFLRFGVHVTTVLQINHIWTQNEKGFIFYFITIYCMFYYYQQRIKTLEASLTQKTAE